jgi:signal transduction histidine kinase
VVNVGAPSPASNPTPASSDRAPNLARAPSPAPGPAPGPVQPTLVDICVGVFLPFLGLPLAMLGSGYGPGARLLSLALDVALAPPVIWRRRSPLVAFYTITAITIAQWIIGPSDQFGTHRLAGYHLVADVALLIAFHTVASQEPRRRTLVAAAVLEAALVIATVRFGGPRNGPALFVLLSGTAAAAGFSGTNARTRRAYLASVEQRAAELEVERDQQARLAVAGERARIARDMHDVVAHNISVMIALADGASYTTADNPDGAAAAMTQVAETGRQALGEMRRLLGVLRDRDQPAAVQPHPGLADVETLLAQVRLTGLRASLVTEGPLPALPPGLQLAVYRLIQESLTNTLKHAKEAETATVMIRVRGGKLEVDVIDDGRPSDGVTPPGHGIAGMRERAAIYGGVVWAGPQSEAWPHAPSGWWEHADFDLDGHEMLP